MRSWLFHEETETSVKEKNNSEEEINKNIAWGEKYFSAQLPEEQPGKQRPMGGGSDGGFPIHRQ